MNDTPITLTDSDNSMPTNNASPEPALSPAPKKFNWMMISVVTLAVLAGGVLGGFGVYYTLGQNKDADKMDHGSMVMTPTPTATATSPTPTKSSPTVTPTSDATAGWKSFSSKYGFSLKYPANGSAQEDSQMTYISRPGTEPGGEILLTFEKDATFGCTGPDNPYENSAPITITIDSVTKSIAPKCYGYVTQVKTDNGTTLWLSLEAFGPKLNQPNGIASDQQLARDILASAKGLSWK